MKRNFGYFTLKILIVLLLFYFIGCKDKTQRVVKIDEISIKRNFNERFLGYYEDDNLGYFLLLDIENKLLKFINIKNFQDDIAIPLNNVFENSQDKDFIISNFFVNRPDSVFISNENNIFLINKKGKILNSWNMENYQGFKQNKLNISFVTPLTFNCGKLNLAITANLKIDNPESCRDYFLKVKPVAILDVRKDSFYCPPISFPVAYQTGNNYMDYVPWFINFDNKLIVSFSISDSLFIYDYKKNCIEQKIALKSRYYASPRPYPYDNFSDFAFRRLYDFSETRYRDVYYDKASNCLLRMVALPTDLKVSGGSEIRKTNDWSLVLYDLSSEKIVDELFFCSEEFQPYLLPTRSGLMIWKMEVNQSDSMKIDVFKVQK